MKTYSFILICLTLGVFYSLAVKMEHQKNLEENSTKIQALVLQNNTDSQKLSLLKSCSNHSARLTTDSEQSHHYDINDDFSMQVTGKAHKYLNTGVSFIDHNDLTAKSDKTTSEFTGS
jgi:hypothetical protein